MISVSDAFQTAIKATVRRFVPKLRITWTDPFIDASITASANDENRINYPEQCADLVQTASLKWAHLDGNIKADGTWYPMPDQVQANAGAEMGWWNAVRCNGSAVWSGTYPTLTIQFAARPVLALTVSGDSVYNEYPVDFDIKIYDGSNVLIYSKTVTGNANLTWNLSIADEGINDAAKMEIIIKKWSAANRLAKITEFYTSVIKEYTGDEIVSMNLLEEREISDGTMPIGNISANELDFSLQNIAIVENGGKIVDPFFYSNPDSYLHNLLKKNRRVEAWLGLVLPDSSVEYVALGTFWTGDWDSPEKGTTVSTTARDRMELLRKAEFIGSDFYENYNLYDLAVAVLNHAKTNIPMPDLTWRIDDELHDFIIPRAWFPRQDYFKTIKQIAEACMGQAYMDRNDCLVIAGPNSVSGDTITTEGA